MTETKPSTYTSAQDFKAAYDTLHATYATNKTKDIRWRKWQLKQLWWLVENNTEAIVKAFAADLGRGEAETRKYDVADVKKDIKDCLDHIDTWAAGHAPEGAGFLFGKMGKAWLRKEPLGVCLIIGAWNVPLMTLLSPLCPAIAAGNCAMLKPSELAPATSDLLVELVPKYMDNSAIRVVTGSVQEMTLILEHKFNHIFYTGGGKVGRIIATAAAKHLTPTVLELGGQCPAIVGKTANLDLAAKRIAHFKLANAGQICINVNHIFAEPEIYDQLIERLKFWVQELLKDDKSWVANIISEGHHTRVTSLLEKTSGKVVFSGEHDPKTKFAHPAIVADVTMSDSLLSEELFAPFIPVIKSSVADAIATIASMPHPLALYVFSSSQPEIDEVLNKTTSGGVSINDVGVHYAVGGFPFGGVGESGHGAYHGRIGFETFSHTRPVVGLPNWLDAPYRYGVPDVNLIANFDSAKASWKRGETLEDQSAGPKGWFSWLW